MIHLMENKTPKSDVVELPTKNGANDYYYSEH